MERVGRALGARGGTGPEDDPLTRSLYEKSLASAHSEAVVAALRARDIDVPAGIAADVDLLAGCSIDTAMTIAMTCTDAADFRRRIRRASR